MSESVHDRYSRLPYPIHKVTASTPVELFELLPGLRRFFNNVDIINRKRSASSDGSASSYRGVLKDDLVKVIKYIMFVYDPNSDLVSEYPDDTVLLKDAAARDAGFRRSKEREGEWPSYIKDIMEFREPDVVQWIIDYLKIRNNAVWQEIKFIEEEIEVFNRNRAKSMQAGEVKSGAMEQVKTRMEERDVLYKRFYADHQDLRKATKDILFPVSPENVFKEMKIPESVWKVRQTRDVPKDQRGNRVLDQGSVQGLPAADTEEGSDPIPGPEED